MSLHALPSGDLLDAGTISAVVVATPGNGAVAWTTLDVSASVPRGARFAIVAVNIAGGTSGGSYVVNQIDFRKDSASALCASVGIKIASTGSALVGTVGTALVPLTVSRTFDYQKTDGTNQGSSGATVSLLGWL